MPSEKNKPAARESEKTTKPVTASETSSCDAVDEASKESFPASDPPPWTMGISQAERENSKP